MSTAPEPTIIGEIKLNSRDVARVDLSVFNGRHVFSARKWYAADDGLRPTAKGITLSVDHLPALASLVAAALARARADGLVPEEDTQWAA